MRRPTRCGTASARLGGWPPDRSPPPGRRRAPAPVRRRAREAAAGLGIAEPGSVVLDADAQPAPSRQTLASTRCLAHLAALSSTLPRISKASPSSMRQLRSGGTRKRSQTLVRIDLGQRIADPIEHRRQRQVRREARGAAGRGARQLVLHDVVHAADLLRDRRRAAAPAHRSAVRNTASGVFRLCARIVSASL